MTIGIIVFLSLIGAVVIPSAGYWLWSEAQGAKVAQAGFKPKAFITENEKHFFRLLCRALGPQWLVLPQVSMGALVDTRIGKESSCYWLARSKFSSKICDYVIVDAKTLTPRLIIELDDVMHDFSKDIARDTVTGRAGYRTIRFWSRAKPSLGELTKLLAKELALCPV
jgi:hypothetical protein